MEQQTENNLIEINVDTELGMWRLGVIAFFFVGAIILFIIFSKLIPGSGINILAGILSLVVTAIIAQQVERFLKPHLNSNRTLQIQDQQIRLISKNKSQFEINGSQHVNVLMWRFKIGRRTRVPKGWFMVACALEQENEYLPVYTFMSPEDFEEMTLAKEFDLLKSRKNTKSSNIGSEDLRLAGKQRRLHQAEGHRWMNGAEMTKDDFINYLTQLQNQFPEWMPSSS
ncbi:MAG: hypothetical protein D6737_17640 [Chloroflexi bacterium]|nr:MAG: hypothetical protein D6737_17640 [Chloroflexota bacterium]